VRWRMVAQKNMEATAAPFSERKTVSRRGVKRIGKTIMIFSSSCHDSAAISRYLLAQAPATPGVTFSASAVGCDAGIVFCQEADGPGGQRTVRRPILFFDHGRWYTVCLFSNMGCALLSGMTAAVAALRTTGGCSYLRWQLTTAQASFGGSQRWRHRVKLAAGTGVLAAVVAFVFRRGWSDGNGGGMAKRCTGCLFLVHRDRGAVLSQLRWLMSVGGAAVAL